MPGTNLNNLAAYNEVATTLGGAGGDLNDIVAVRAIAVLEGVSGGPADVSDDNMTLRLNAIDVGAGGAGGNLNTLDALNSIVVLKGGVGGHENDLDAINEWVDFVESTLPNVSGLACYFDFVEGVDDQELENKASDIGSSHADANQDFTLGADSSPSTDDPTWEATPASADVGLAFDGGDLCLSPASIDLVGDFVISVAARLDDLTLRSFLGITGIADFLRVTSATSITFRLNGVAHVFTIAALGTTKWGRFLFRRVGTVLNIRINGVLNTEITGVSSVDFNFDTIGNRGDPGSPYLGNIAEIAAREVTMTDEELATEETRLKDNVKKNHGLVNGDFA